MGPPGSTQDGARRRRTRFQTVHARLSVFATDLDRTLLKPGDAPTRTARTALRMARVMGLRTLLVSGRPHSELVGFARAYGEFDGIVAENGAVVEAPVGSPPSVVGRRTAASVRRRLEGRAGLRCEFGEIVVSVPLADRRRLFAAVAHLPVDVLANVDRLMVLPKGVTKRTGTRTAMRQFRLSGTGYAAIGDAENDLDLLAGASLSGAVRNAGREVRSVADYVCRSRFDRGVLEFVQGPLSELVGEISASREVSGVRPGLAPALR